MDLLDEETEELTYFLTLLIAAVAPATHKAATYELVYEMLGSGDLTEDTVAMYGALIRATAFEGVQEIH